MKKRIAAILILMILTAGTAACGTSYDADTATLYIQKNGKVVSTDVEAFDETSYDKAELESYVADAVSAYAEENGKNTVKLKKLEVEDGTAQLVLEYASAADYAEFNGAFLFTGSVAEALAAGYTFDAAFVSADDGSACTTAEAIDDGSLHVAIVKAFVNVKVSGNIVYYSGEYTELLDKKTVSIAAENASETEAATEDAGTEALAEAESETEGVLLDGSVSDDEMLTGEEEAEITFDFGSDADGKSKETPAAGYVYVIYK